MPNATDLTYETIDPSYNNFLERASNNATGVVIGNENSTSADSGSTQTSSSSSAGGSVSAETAITSGLDNIWIKSWIKSKNFSPKVKGFMIDGISGKIECMDLIATGTITAISGTIGGWTIDATSIYTGTEDHSGYTANAGDMTLYSNGTDASIHAKNFYIDTTGAFYATGGSLDGTSTIGGRLASVLATAIDTSGHFADSAISTATNTILGSFTFGASGALQIGTYVNGVSGDLKISPTGILGRDINGDTTFSINGATGVAVLNGLVVGTNVGIGTAVDSAGVTTIVGNTVTTDYINAKNITAAYVNASISITTPTISGGTITIGTSNNVFIAGANGIQLGHATFASALFSVDMVGNCKVKSLQRSDTHWFTLFESIDGYGISTDGTGSISLGQSYVSSVTGVVTNNINLLQKVVTNPNSRYSWDKNRRIESHFRPVDTHAHIFFIGMGDGTVGITRKIGFWGDGTSLKGVSADGSNTTYTESSTIITGADYSLEIVYVAGVSATYYVNGTSIGVITTTLPSGTTLANWLLNVYNTTTENAAQTLWVSYYDFWQAA
jgi:hypothetical protein